jgi:hypothetical protein
MPVETEIKYVMALSKLRAQIDLSGLECEEISQHYYSAEKIRQQLIPQLRAMNASDVDLLPDDCSNGRIRSSKSNKSISYTLTVKAPRADPFSRLEVEISITESLYNKLLRFVDMGSLSKQRYYLAGTLADKSAVIRPLTAEIDIYNEIAGKSFDLNDPLAFAVVEVEAASLEQLQEIRDGHHSFYFLRDAVEVLSLPEDCQKYFKNMYLALHGLDQAAIKSIMLTLV